MIQEKFFNFNCLALTMQVIQHWNSKYMCHIYTMLYIFLIIHLNSSYIKLSPNTKRIYSNYLGGSLESL